MDPWLLKRVTGSLPHCQAAAVHGYVRDSLRGYTFPGVRPSNGQRVDGLFISNMNSAQLQTLDAYEADEYDRVRVRCVTAGGMRVAWMYCLNHIGLPLATKPAWSFERWQCRYRARALRRSGIAARWQ